MAVTKLVEEIGKHKGLLSTEKVHFGEAHFGEAYFGHWCIKSIYNGFAIAIDCTLKVAPFSFCSVQVMPLFRISF